MLERLAIIEEDGIVPAVFREAWARFNCECPAGISADRWSRAIVASGLLLEAWGARAAELGWRADELFAPGFGLVWLLTDFDGAMVSSLDCGGAMITNQIGGQQRYHRRWKQ